MAQFKSIFFKYLLNIYLEEKQCGKKGRLQVALPRFCFIIQSDLVLFQICRPQLTKTKANPPKPVVINLIDQVLRS